MRRKNSMRLVIADDHVGMREGLTAIISKWANMAVVAKACTWPEAIRKVARCRPDIALLDIHMPGLEASQGVAAIHKTSPSVRIVMLSAFDIEEEVYSVVQAGVKGFLLKGGTASELLRCLRTVHAGGTFFASEPTAKLAARIQAPQMTKRQIRTLELIAAGKTNKEIASLMNVTEGTVKIHVNHVFRKLGVGGRAAAIARGLERGIVKLSTSA
jgi:DNA-binding NarL/FixJ family response regulator